MIHNSRFYSREHSPKLSELFRIKSPGPGSGNKWQPWDALRSIGGRALTTSALYFRLQLNLSGARLDLWPDTCLEVCVNYVTLCVTRGRPSHGNDRSIINDILNYYTSLSSLENLLHNARCVLFGKVYPSKPHKLTLEFEIKSLRTNSHIQSYIPQNPLQILGLLAKFWPR